MKCIKCEMCGSTDMVKSEGLFVCQNCGCKYTVEEARKLMSEDPVTVKIDGSEQVNNYITLSEAAFNSSDSAAALNYANKALELNPESSAAWFAKMLAATQECSINDPHGPEIYESGKRAIQFASDDEKASVSFKVYLLQAKTALSMFQRATYGYNLTKELEDAFQTLSLINPFTSAQQTMEADSNFILLVEKYLGNAIAFIRFIPAEAFDDVTELVDTIKKCAQEYQRTTEALVARYKIYGASLLDEAKNNREKNRQMMQEKAEAILKVANEKKREQIRQYWENNPELKSQLEDERVSLSEVISHNKAQMDMLPEQLQLNSLNEQIKKLSSEQDSLSLFKRKEKKAIQDQIDSMKAEANALSVKLETARRPLQREIDRAEARNKEIEKELGL